ncbi:unnamed protein product [Effrenium voratum]|uniref:EF-hand domain-containing protein n=1 Tax=Effrenium voratum TaxID=2562239 RepID=A0AA36JR41_9DINO|nr:unnamed protein product [Effrenium voratum]
MSGRRAPQLGARRPSLVGASGLRAPGTGETKKGRRAPGAPGGTRGRSASPHPSGLSSPPSPTLPMMARTGPQAQRPSDVDFRPPGVSWGTASYSDIQAAGDNGLSEPELRAIYSKLDKNKNGTVSKLELIAAVSQEKSIADMLGIDGESLLSDEKCFDELHTLFEEISAGKKGIDFDSFAKHVRKACADKTPRSNRMQEIFNLIDADASGSISKLELVAAMQNNTAVDEFLMPGVDSSRIMDDENLFEKIDGLFEDAAVSSELLCDNVRSWQLPTWNKKVVYLVRHAESMENVRVHAFDRVCCALRAWQRPARGDVLSALRLLCFDLNAPLSSRGERQLSDVKAQLQGAGFMDQALPELLVFSPLVRAERTGEVLFGSEVPIRQAMPGIVERTPREACCCPQNFEERVQHFKEWLAGIPQTRVLVVAHCQFFSKLLGKDFGLDRYLSNAEVKRCIFDPQTEVFDELTTLFLPEAIAGGKKRFTYYDFEKYFRKAVVAATPRPPSNMNRSSTRVFIIGPGFGNQINPRQSRMVEAAGYQIRWCFNVPNPEIPNFPVEPYLGQIKMEMDQFQPHVVVGASKGGVYIVGLWERYMWRGPTVLINAHPMCNRLPQEANVAMAVGSNDEVYPISRAELEVLMNTGGQNKTFIYWTADSGRLPSGQISRQGDTHNQESLLHHDVLPRLIDAVLCKEGPEIHFHRTWKERLSVPRNEAELWLGFSPQEVTRLWSTNGYSSSGHLFDVQPGTEEFRMVNAAFKALPMEQQAYILSPPEMWAPVRALRIQRVENGPQGDASWKPYYKSLGRPLAQTPDAADGVSLFFVFPFPDSGSARLGSTMWFGEGNRTPRCLGAGVGKENVCVFEEAPPKKEAGLREENARG